MIKFASWHRQGLAAGLGSASTASVTAWVELAGVASRIEHTVELAGPGLVSSISAGAFGRREPAADAHGVPTTQLVHIEVSQPDLPWRYTPRGPDESGQIQPWLALVVVEESATVRFVQESSRARLEVDASAVATQLPVLSPLWAHVEIVDDVPVLARLVCPRRLPPHTRLRACVVPAHEAGRLAGLGQPLSTSLAPAWDVAAPTDVVLPVYTTWTFETGEADDFETLCRRLRPADAEALCAPRDVIVDDPLLALSKPRRTIAFHGAIMPADARPSSGASDELVAAVTALAHDDSAGDEPIVAPPRYGAFAAGARGVWRSELDGDPAHRAAAGLGAEIARVRQEVWMAELWRQAGEVDTFRARVERGKLAARIAGRWQARAKVLDDVEVVQLASPLLMNEQLDDKPITDALHETGVPRGTLGRATLRVLRPGAKLQRTAQLQRPAGLLTAKVITSSKMEIGTLPSTSGAYTSTSWLDAIDERSADSKDPQITARRAELGVPKRIRAQLARSTVPVQPTRAPATQLPVLARTALAAKDPIRQRLRAQLTRDGAVVADPDARVTLSPRIDDALATALYRRSPELLAPGLGGLAEDRVALVAANPAFIAAFMVGANHELDRELLWREYPTARDITILHRFWSETRDDIRPIESWNGPLATAGVSSSPLLLVVRGELVRRYPDLGVRLVEAKLEDGVRAPASRTIDPSFMTTLSADLVLVGFTAALTAAQIRGARTVARPGWYVVFEQRDTRLRFGLEAPDRIYGKAPVSWNDLAWSHLFRDAKAYERATHLPTSAPAGFGAQPAPARWGRSAADQARILARNPFRLYLHGELLLGDSDA